MKTEGFELILTDPEVDEYAVNVTLIRPVLHDKGTCSSKPQLSM